MTNINEEYKAIDREGNTLTEGDAITDFRGSAAIFLRVTRLTEPGRSAKVLVRWPATSRLDAREMEYYSNVFDITIESR